jgi:hypothetical protein
VNFTRYDDVQLTGVPISSNSTGMVHSEQIHTLDGAIRLTKSPTAGDQVENGSKLALHSVCVVRKPTADEAASKTRGFEAQWIGDLSPGQSAPISKMLPFDPKEPIFIDERVAEGQRIETPRLNLEPMVRLALDPQHIEEGETRLVARVDEVLPGETITPTASQVRGATLVVAHLKYAHLPEPEKDRNTRRDINVTDDPPEEPLEL